MSLSNHHKDSPTTVAPAQQYVALCSDLAGLPFDVVRAQYARAVQVGLLQPSMLASRNFARFLGAVEQLTLGPWARHV